MELNGYRLLLPEGTLDYFDLVDVKESVNEVVIYLEEKNIVPEKYTDQDTESKGFYDPVIVQDFPLRGKMVFTYQGDGDLAAIGTAETIHAANRGENIVIVFVNNAIYGMTGGQMAPTTLEGMPTATCPYGRNIALNGYPLKIGDLLAQLEGTCLVTRQSVHTAAAVRKAKKMLRKAFENSMAGKGTSIVEFVSTCSSGWKMTPEKANKWMEENMFPFYPLGDLKNKE